MSGRAARENIPTRNDKIAGDVADQVQEKAPVYAAKAKEVAADVAGQVQEKAPVYFDKLKVVAGQAAVKIRENAPVVAAKVGGFISGFVSKLVEQRASSKQPHGDEEPIER